MYFLYLDLIDTDEDSRKKKGVDRENESFKKDECKPSHNPNFNFLPMIRNPGNLIN